LEAGESVGFGVEDDVCEGQDVVGGEEEVEVFEGLGLVGLLLVFLLPMLLISMDSPARNSPCCPSTAEALSSRRSHC